ncbi:MAG: hypothetical protein LBH28_04650 [Oscillospiraceae bacterium]|jgi:hypothetical protein|nr:hypothetical protein [Oscillospiraceae bacterium]
MNAYERTIQEALENIQSSPNASLRSRVMNSADSGIGESMPIFRRRVTARAALISVVFAVVALTTAFTYGNQIVGVIRQVFFGDSVASQIVSDVDLYVGSGGVVNRGDLSEATDYPLGVFETLEEARQAAPFPISEPSYLPANVTGLRNVGVWRVEAEEGPWMHFVIVSYDIELTGGGVSILGLRQTYAGPDAYLEIESVSPIEKVMVGDSEAVLISAPEKFVQGNGTVIINEDIVGYTLSWLKDGVAYELQANYHDGYTPETMIRIAESIR